VVLFGECLPEEAVEALERVVRDEPRDLVVAVGTTGVFPYIQYPVDVAREEGVPTFEINPDVGEMTRHVEYRIAERAAVAMERLWTLAHGAADPAHGEGA
jgi:NAD-dependent SIR2 family protein deacetylase